MEIFSPQPPLTGCCCLQTSDKKVAGVLGTRTHLSAAFLKVPPMVCACLSRAIVERQI